MQEMRLFVEAGDDANELIIVHLFLELEYEFGNETWCCHCVETCLVNCYASEWRFCIGSGYVVLLNPYGVPRKKYRRSPAFYAGLLSFDPFGIISPLT